MHSVADLDPCEIQLANNNFFIDHKCDIEISPWMRTWKLLAFCPYDPEDGCHCNFRIHEFSQHKSNKLALAEPRVGVYKKNY